ncbi:MAG: PadR family transcriptional regulator [Nitrospirae bacterium]|nr:PadR family transcriptional regulator [Nitrospirota bacterium]
MDVKTLCLGALSLGDATGYDIKKLFEEAFSHFFVAGYGSIYPALEKLAEQGHVSYQRQRQEKRPDKKMFSLTSAGREALVQELVSTAPREKCRSEFLVLMFFAHLLPPQRLAEILQQSLDENKKNLKMLEELEKKDCPPGIKFTIRYGLAMTKAAIGSVEQSRDALMHEVYSRQPGFDACQPDAPGEE